MSGERDLWAGVLDRAIEDLKKADEHKSAMYWFKNKKNTGVRSFIWICDVLGYDADKTRNRVLYNNRVCHDEAHR